MFYIFLNPSTANGHYNGHCETTLYLQTAFSKDSRYLPTLKRGFFISKLELPRESKKNKELDKTKRKTKQRKMNNNGHLANSK